MIRRVRVCTLYIFRWGAAANRSRAYEDKDDRNAFQGLQQCEYNRGSLPRPHSVSHLLPGGVIKPQHSTKPGMASTPPPLLLARARASQSFTMLSAVSARERHALARHVLTFIQLPILPIAKNSSRETHARRA